MGLVANIKCMSCILSVHVSFNFVKFCNTFSSTSQIIFYCWRLVNTADSNL